LEVALHHVDLQEVPNLLSEENLLLYLYGVTQQGAFRNFFTGLDAALVKHVVVTREGLHHALQQPAVEHERGFVDENGRHIITNTNIQNNTNISNQY
jgi:uncharacterized protein YqjF (DUF2071 family)